MKNGDIILCVNTFNGLDITIGKTYKIIEYIEEDYGCMVEIIDDTNEAVIYEVEWFTMN